MTATSDCVWVEASAPEDALDELCGPVLKAVRDAGYDPLTQMQVLIAAHRAGARVSTPLPVPLPNNHARNFFAGDCTHAARSSWH